MSAGPVGDLVSLKDWGPVRASGTNLDRSATFDVRNVTGRSVLLWLTQLPVGANGRHYLDVSEVTVA